MKFTEAMEAARGGAKVRRAGWEDETAAVHKGNGTDSGGIVVSSETGYAPYSPTEEDVRGEDWEIVDGEDGESGAESGSGVAGEDGDGAVAGGATGGSDPDQQ